MHFFITGHTGFKGSWLILLLRTLGHNVSGFALEPLKGGLFERANLRTDLTRHFIGDIRDKQLLEKALRVTKPDVAIHLAAQPLVLRSYEDPIETYTTNVDGTRNFLEAITVLDRPPTSLVVTTDKVYRDSGKAGHRESDPLGGHDPYSTSKAMADLLTQGWALSNPQLKLFIARAGNVIGAYDISENRLIPDAIRSVTSNKPIRVRNPQSIRPWQHVLDCLNGYIMYIEASIRSESMPLIINFGPNPNSAKRVSDVIRVIQSELATFKVEFDSIPSTVHETKELSLDSSLAMNLLNWKNEIDFEESVKMSIAELGDQSPRQLVQNQIDQFLRKAALRGHSK